MCGSSTLIASIYFRRKSTLLFFAFSFFSGARVLGSTTKMRSAEIVPSFRSIDSICIARWDAKSLRSLSLTVEVRHHQLFHLRGRQILLHTEGCSRLRELFRLIGQGKISVIFILINLDYRPRKPPSVRDGSCLSVSEPSALR